MHFSFQDTPVVQAAQASRPREAAGPKIPVINPLLSTASCAAYTPSWPLRETSTAKPRAKRPRTSPSWSATCQRLGQRHSGKTTLLSSALSATIQVLFHGYLKQASFLDTSSGAQGSSRGSYRILSKNSVFFKELIAFTVSKNILAVFPLFQIFLHFFARS